MRTSGSAGSQRGRLLVVSTLAAEHGWGGSETYWFNALLDGVAANLDVEVVLARSQPAEARAELLRQGGVGVRWSDGAALSDIQRAIAAARRRMHLGNPDSHARWWQKVFGDFAPDLVWFNLTTASAVELVSQPSAIAVRAGIPYWIIMQHAFEDGFAYDDGGADAWRRSLLAARRTIFVAEGNRRSVERSIATSLSNAVMSMNTVSDRFIASATEVRARHPPRRSGRATLLCLARIDPAFKGQHILLEVLAQEQWRHRDWRLLLVGGGRLSETVHRLVRYYGLDDGRVDMVGHEGDVIPVIASADLIVMPSLSEGTPYAAVEGMAAGRPVVATPVGGFAELVSDGRTGWLAEAATSAHFAEALERAWSMRAEWAEIGDAAADYVAEHCRSKPTHDNLKELLLADVRHRAL